MIPKSIPIKTIEVSRGPLPSSGIQTYPFQIRTGGTQVKFLLMTHLLMGGLDLQVLDWMGEPLWAPYSVSEQMYRSIDAYLGGPGSSDPLYQLQITEQNVVGRYRIVVARQAMNPICRTVLNIGALLAY